MSVYCLFQKVILNLSFYRQYNCTNEQVANNTTSNPCYEAKSVFWHKDTAIYDQPNLSTSDHCKAKMSSNVAYRPTQSSLRQARNAITDVTLKDDDVIENVNSATTDEHVYAAVNI